VDRVSRNLRQACEALALANEVRARRAAWRDDLRGLEVFWACTATISLLRGCPIWAASWTVHRVLLCVPTVGPSQAERILLRAGAGERRTVRELTERQREVIVDALRERAARGEVAA